MIPSFCAENVPLPTDFPNGDGKGGGVTQSLVWYTQAVKRPKFVPQKLNPFSRSTVAFFLSGIILGSGLLL